jgi:hypothetical protein
MVTTSGARRVETTRRRVRLRALDADERGEIADARQPGLPGFDLVRVRPRREPLARAHGLTI